MNEKPASSPSFVRPQNSPVFCPSGPVLVLPRRGPQTRTQRGTAAGFNTQSSAGNQQVAEQHAQSGDNEVLGLPLEPRDTAEREAAVGLQALEQVLNERERAVEERERRVSERERDLAEAEVLLRHHETLVQVARKAAPAKGKLSAQEEVAQAALKAELDRQEAVLRESREALREREKFIEDSETRLFEKVQDQQEKETELEQREEELRERTCAGGQSVAGGAEKKRTFDEFNE